MAIYVKSHRRGKSIVRSYSRTSALRQMKQVTVGHAYVLNLPSRGSVKELNALERRGRRVSKILAIKRSRGKRKSAYK